MQVGMVDAARLCDEKSFQRLDVTFSGFGNPHRVPAFAIDPECESSIARHVDNHVMPLVGQREPGCFDKIGSRSIAKQRIDPVVTGGNRESGRSSLINRLAPMLPLTAGAASEIKD